MFPSLNIGPFVFPTAGLILILGAWICLMIIEKAAEQLTLPAQKIYALAVVGLAAGFIGARLTFVALYWPAYQENLISIIWPLTSGYQPVGGLIIGTMAAFFYGRAQQLPLTTTLDALAPGLVMGFMVISLADFAGGPGYGTLTAMPWGVSQYGVRRHPVQLYELLVGIVALIIWWGLVDRRRFAGQLFLAATAVYSAGRLFFDAYRDNTWLAANGYHLWQIISFIILLISLVLLTYGYEKSLKIAEEEPATLNSE